MTILTMTFTDEQLHRLVWVALIMTLEYLGLLAAIVIDLRAGIIKARRRGEKCTSRGFRRTVDKATRYYIALMVLSVLDTPLIACMLYLRADMGWTLPVFPLFTTLGAVAMTAIEVKSVLESSQQKGDYRRLLDDLTKLLDDESVRRLIKNLRE